MGKGLFLFIICIGIIILSGCANQRQNHPDTSVPLEVSGESDFEEIEEFNGYIRVNQLGYLPDAAKTAYILSNEVIPPASIQLVDDRNLEVVFVISTAEDQGSYAAFQHLYRIDFSEWQQTGSYRIQIDGYLSYPFQISDNLYDALVVHSLQFFEAQHCSDEHSSLHPACHSEDGISSGSVVDASGGWHDAGDYIKFSITSGYSTYLLLHSAEVEQNPYDAVAVFHEAEVGLSWLSKLWDAENDLLYYQVSDEADHEEWRMPQEDHLNPRPVYVCEEGKGANIAGKSAAAMALASRLYGNSELPWYDVELAESYLDHARSLYDFGKRHPQAQPSNPAEFYTETTWKDDMALAAVELYTATQEEQYQQDFEGWLAALGKGSGFSWGEMGAAAMYKAAKAELILPDEAISFLDADLRIADGLSNDQAFSVAIPAFHWGSAETMASLVLEAMWYADLTKDNTYQAMAMKQMDYILGANPWGVSWVSGIGSNWSRNPHHQIADLTESDLPGFWNEGAVPAEVFESSGPETLLEPDEYAEFQTDQAVYHDDTEDWVTNEPTITMNATGIAVCSWLSIK